MATTPFGQHASQSNKKEQSRVKKKYKAEIGAIEPNFPPVLRDEAIAPPAKPGMPTASIGPGQKVGPGWRGAVKKAPVDPKDYNRPAHSDVVKT